jgi:hypothetical protein
MRQEARDNPSNTDVRNRFKALIIAFFNRLSPQLLEAWVGCRVPTPLSEVTRLDPVVPPNRGDVPERPLESLAIDSVMQSVEDPNFVQLLPMLPQDRMHPFFSQFLRRAQSHNEPRDNLRHDLLVHIRTEVLGGGEAVVECPVM